MVSNLIMTGLILAMAVSILLPIGCAIYVFKKAGARGNIWVLIMGFAIAVVAKNLGSVITSLIPMKNLMNTTMILYMFIMALIIGGIDFAGRYLGIRNVSKNGLGLYKCLSLGVGFAFGQVLLQASYYNQLLMHARLIDNGTFYETMISQEGVTAEAISQYEEVFLSLHNMTYLAQAVEQGAMVFLNIALIMLLVKFMLEHKAFIGGVIIAGVRTSYELLRLLTYYLHTEYMNHVTSETTALILNIIVNVAVLAGAVVCILKLWSQIPVEKMVMRTNTAPKKKKQIEVSDKKAWQEVKQINRKLDENIEEEI